MEREAKTEFNAAVASLMRLHNLLVDCNNQRRDIYYNGYNLEALKAWKLTLEAVYSEMYPKIAENEENLKKVEKLFSYYKKCGNLLIKKVEDQEELTTVNITAFNNYIKVNDIIEKRLRQIADRKGMLIPNEEDMFGR